MIANSPHIMIQNFSQMPFVKVDTELQTVHFDNLFLRVDIFHLELDPQCLLMITDGFYKKNVLDIMLYDKRIPSRHYFLSLKTMTEKVSSSSTMVNGTSFSSNTWSLCKPEGIKNVSHFKNAKEQFFTVYFTQEWLNEYLNSCDADTRNFFKEFMVSDTPFLMFPRREQDDLPDYNLFYDVFKKMIPTSKINSLEFQELTMEMFAEFSSSIPQGGVLTENFKLSNENRLNVIKAEHYLSQFVVKEFPGVEAVAKYCGISPTGLKKGFQQLYGTTLFGYHRQQKMKIAHAALKRNPSIKIKELAAQLGYVNAAKFASGFKEVIGVSPSSLKQ
jgi:AraC-like DNA-binding protein